MECQLGQMTVEQAQYVNQYNHLQQGQYGGNAYQNRYQNQNHNPGMERQEEYSEQSELWMKE